MRDVKYTYDKVLEVLRSLTQCDDICIVAVFNQRVDFEMLGDVGVMEAALDHIARDLRIKATVEQWEQEAKT